jgi:thiol:disulfide interchange protein
MILLRTLRCLLPVLLVAAMTVFAQQDDPTPHSDARLVSERTSIKAGKPFWVGLYITLDKGWHSYWKNPGDSGTPPIIDWELPIGFKAGEIQWPTPGLIRVPPLAAYGYEKEVLLPIRIDPPEELRPGTSISLKGKVDYVVCEEECLPAAAELNLKLPVRNSETVADSRWQEKFEATRLKLPGTAQGWLVNASSNSDEYVLKLRPASRVDLDGTHFFAADPGVINHAAPQSFKRSGDSFEVSVKRSEFASGAADRLRGVLVMPRSSGAPAVELDVPVVNAKPAAASTGEGKLTLTFALASALAGGLILNLMPCVFPVLSLKVLSFVQHGGSDRRRVRTRGLAFVAGLMMSFLAIAGVLLALRAAGRGIGWGFQLQSPLFVAALAMLFFLMALNLLGVFEIGLTLTRLGKFGGTDSYVGSFATGILAVVVSTPCTAPFMGAALGFALAQSGLRAVLIFAALGAGMALPYLVLAMRPSLLNRLPEPGAWMKRLKQFLAFPLFATVIWLAWVLGHQTGINGVAQLLAALLAVASAVWLWRAKHVAARIAGLAIVLVAAAAVVLASGNRARSAVPVSREGSVQWEKYSHDRVAELRSQGRTVFIDFTAAWCITCQVNKRTTLKQDSVEQAFKNRNVALLVADWTNSDPEITKALQAFGRSGVPLYVMYNGNSEPLILPEILTEGLVLNALSSVQSAGIPNSSISE